MTLPLNWTQLQSRNHGTHVEVTIHFLGPWIRMGIGPTLEAAISDAVYRPAIAMGEDAPMLVDASRICVEPPRAG